MNNIDIIDEALRIVYLENAKILENVNQEKELELILHQSDSYEMSFEMSSLLLQKLEDVAFSMSFGEVLKQKLKDMSMAEVALSQQTKLPLPVIASLLSDSIYTNNVPIVILKNLLNVLKINFEAAEKSIRKTFEILQSRDVDTALISGLNPIYRKGLFISKETLSSVSNRNEGKELYENKESMEKYLNRLEELLNTNN
ncbi:MAG: hypothetical protein H7Y13_03775 [Sphingobacteriaceae bacterium]|nr:hypothetical protein [Sphingobacteriaceae bacterium]